jgi:hypothetical protein
MAETLVSRDGQTTTVISDSYAFFGEIQTGPPVPPDDPSKWHAPSLDETAVSKRYGVSMDDLLSWHGRVNFLQPDRTVTKTRFGSWKVQAVRHWNVYRLEEWEVSIANVAAHIPR